MDNKSQNQNSKFTFLIYTSILLVGVLLVVTFFAFTKYFGVQKWLSDPIGLLADNITSEFEKNLVINDQIQNINQNITDENALNAVTPESTTPTKQQAVQEEEPVVYQESCYVYKIDSPDDVKSSKCYLLNDYYKIIDYHSAYQNAIFTKDWAERAIDITCDNKDFYGNSCDEYKKDLSDAKKDIEKYRKLVQELISKGK